MKKILEEGLLVAILGIGLAYAANFLSPHRLPLTSNPFPSKNVAATNPVPNRVASLLPTGTNTQTARRLLEEELTAKGLSLADSNKVSQFFRDPKYDMGLIIFVDARDDQEYQAGHVPGAYQLDHFRPGNYLPAVLAACHSALENVVVYCNGGDCADSKETAFLLTPPVPKEKISVYVGGFNEWTNNRMPVEIGERKSGKLLGSNSPAVDKNPK